jgi:hypothetical protein
MRTEELLKIARPALWARGAVVGLAVLMLTTLALPAAAQDTGGEVAAGAVTVLEETAIPGGVQVSQRIDVSQDAFLSSARSNANFGFDRSLRLGWEAGGNEAMRMLIQFPLNSIPSNASISSAQLFINQTGSVPSSDFDMVLRAQYMREAWNEFSVTWNNANFLGGDVLPLVSVNNAPGWKSGDATNLVRSWVSGAQPNHGLIVTGDETPSLNRSRRFSAREDTGFGAYLIVDFSTACDTAPPVATVEALPLFSPGSFRVSWTGQDFAPSGCQPSGVAHYDVEYRINGGSWQRWRSQTTELARTFEGFAGNNDLVEFRVRATDNAGNSQSFGSPQANTRVDTQPPVASMNPLPEFQTSPNFVITWGGTDNLSGIATYDVQFRVNGGQWQWLLEGTTQVSYQVGGAQAGVLYEGRVRAIDAVGNAQEWSDAPQASTTVFDQPVSEVLPFNPPILKPTAPITNSFTVRWTGVTPPGTTIAAFEIFYRFNGGAWQIWQTFPGAQTSEVFPFAALGLGDGVYEFESVASNSAGQREPRSQQPEASIAVDLADVIEPRLRFPLTFGAVTQ